MLGLGFQVSGIGSRSLRYRSLGMNKIQEYDHAGYVWGGAGVTHKRNALREHTRVRSNLAASQVFFSLSCTPCGGPSRFQAYGLRMKKGSALVSMCRFGGAKSKARALRIRKV